LFSAAIPECTQSIFNIPQESANIWHKCVIPSERLFLRQKRFVQPSLKLIGESDLRKNAFFCFSVRFSSASDIFILPQNRLSHAPSST
jgi:hypothetical protein